MRLPAPGMRPSFGAMRTPLRPLARPFAALALLLAASCVHTADTPRTLRAAAGDAWLIGCPVGEIDFEDPALLALVRREFNCVTVETELMPFKLGADRAAFDFAPADRIVAWAEEHGLPVFGHMLLWDYRTPSWLFQDETGAPLARDRGLANLREYIQRAMTHYRGRFVAWNVVNEAVSDEPGEFLRDTAARRSIGDDYIEHAFRFAAEADPGVELYYNDYNVVVPEKRDKILRLVLALRESGCRIDSVGMQGHWMLHFPEPAWIDAAIEAFAAAGFTVRITELDVDVLPRTHSGANMTSVEEGPDPYPGGLPRAVEAELADHYGDIFDRLLAHEAVLSITFWGSHDGRSWLNDFPVTGRTNHPLLFDRELRRKPAHASVLAAFADARARRSAARTESGFVGTAR